MGLYMNDVSANAISALSFRIGALRMPNLHGSAIARMDCALRAESHSRLVN